MSRKDVIQLGAFYGVSYRLALAAVWSKSRWTIEKDQMVWLDLFTRVADIARR